MKRIFVTIVAVLVTVSIFSQAPQKMSYQAVVRNTSGVLIANQTIGMKISILQGSATGTPVFVETQTTNTNANGLAIIEIGGGTIVTGTFAGINWSTGIFFIKTETDPAGGTNYTITGTSQLLSVPYAFFAGKVQTSSGRFCYRDKDGDGFGDVYSLLWIPVDVNLPTGYVLNGEDCKDLDASIHPGAPEIRGDGIDQDCNGSDLESENFELGSKNPIEAAKSVGIYEGLLSANWILPDGSASFDTQKFSLGYGLLSSFGPNVTPLEGNQLLALSTGTARQPTDPGYLVDLDKGYSISCPSGFPSSYNGCPVPTSAHDGVALKVNLQVPEGVTSFSFNYKFYTKEYPSWTCSAYNDIAVVLVNPSPVGSINGNVIFDSNGNPVTVNSSNFLSCCIPSNGYLCYDGTSELLGTGFESNGGSKWLSASVPVQPNSTIVITFAIWDSGDRLSTSTILFDNWKWIK